MQGDKTLKYRTRHLVLKRNESSELSAFHLLSSRFCHKLQYSTVCTVRSCVSDWVPSRISSKKNVYASKSSEHSHPITGGKNVKTLRGVCVTVVLNPEAESGAYARDSLPISAAASIHLYLNRCTPSGQSRVYRVTQLRTDGVHCRESAGTGPVVLKVVFQ